MRRSWHSELAYPFTLNWPLLPINPSLFSLIIALLWLTGVADGQQLSNLTIPFTSPQFVYTPFVCNTTAVKNDPQLCAGAWHISVDNKTISTQGPVPNNSSTSLIPQLFFQFRASDLFITTEPSSNATVNITASSNGTSVSTMFDSSLGSATIVNLPDALSLLTITFVTSNAPTTFDLEKVVITTLQNESSTSIFPSQTLPPSMSLSFSTPSATSTSSTAASTSTSPVSSHSGKSKQIAEGVGITLGVSLGLTAIISTLFYCWKRRRQRGRRMSSIGGTQSERRNNVRHG